MILLIDSYDSFSYNLVQAIGSIDADIRVVRNDELTLDEIRALHPDRIVLSPGPGRASSRRPNLIRTARCSPDAHPTCRSRGIIRWPLTHPRCRRNSR